MQGGGGAWRGQVCLPAGFPWPWPGGECHCVLGEGTPLPSRTLGGGGGGRGGALGSSRASSRYLPPQHQDTRELRKVPATYAINTVQVNGQEKYLIVSVGVGGSLR